jgi:hypothetical protein
MSLEQTVSTISGDIRSMKDFFEGTWQSSAEVTKDRLTDAVLRKEWAYTNNHALNCVEDGNAILYFGSKDSSIFRADTIDEAFRQLRDSSTGNYYRPGSEDVLKAKQTSLRLRISDLELKFDNKSDVYGYFEIDTTDFTGEKLNDAQRQFAEAVYGSMKADESGDSDYSKAMKMFNNDGKGIKITRIYTLRKEAVLRDAKDGAVARACGLDGVGSDFVAVDRGVGSDCFLRGVREVREADATKLVTLPEDKLNATLAQYLGPRVLGQVKADLAKHYQ